MNEKRAFEALGFLLLIGGGVICIGIVLLTTAGCGS